MILRGILIRRESAIYTSTNGYVVPIISAFIAFIALGETVGPVAVMSYLLFWRAAAITLIRRSPAPLPAGGISSLVLEKIAFAKAKAQRRDLEKLVAVDIGHHVLERHAARWRQRHRLVRSGSGHLSACLSAR